MPESLLPRHLSSSLLLVGFFGGFLFVTVIVLLLTMLVVVEVLLGLGFFLFIYLQEHEK